MKRMHHCIPEVLGQIRAATPGDTLFDYRTGFVPQIYPGDRVELYERPGDAHLAHCTVLDVQPTQVVPELYKGIYNRPFHQGHWFFRFILRVDSVEK